MSCHFVMGTAVAEMACVVVACLHADLLTLWRKHIGSLKNMVYIYTV
jgi:hypothetical protein